MVVLYCQKNYIVTVCQLTKNKIYLSAGKVNKVQGCKKEKFGDWLSYDSKISRILGKCSCREDKKKMGSPYDWNLIFINYLNELQLRSAELT